MSMGRGVHVHGTGVEAGGLLRSWFSHSMFMQVSSLHPSH